MNRAFALIILGLCIWQLVEDYTDWFWWVGLAVCIYVFLNPKSLKSNYDHNFDHDIDCGHDIGDCGED